MKFTESNRACNFSRDVLFSVIIPMYNVENYIVECIRSLLDQPFDSVELIVVDDQSNDGSVSNCQALIDMGYEFILLGQRQSGPNVARNLGISYATGQYVLFVDADDRLVPSSFEILSRELQKFHDADVISFGYEFFNDQTGVVQNIARLPKRHLRSNDIFRESLRGRNFGGVCWNKCYKLSFLLETKILFYPDTAHGRDLIFTRTVAFRAEEWRSIDAVLYQSRLRAGSYSRNFNERNINSAIDVIAKHLDIFQTDALNQGAISDLYYAAYRHLWYITILSAFRSINFKEHKNYCNLIQSFSRKRLSESALLQSNLSIYDKAIHFLVGKPILIWAIARILKRFNYEPY